MTDFETVIGLEVHVELSTASKMFCSCPVCFSNRPNENTCPVCTGMPGAMPSVNGRAVEFAVRAGLALGCDIQNYTDFDRKNYFYPDLPKAYQISQLYHPICIGGQLDIGGKVIRLDNIHMEEDAGKLCHDPIDGATLIDYNRGGVPLLEIVTVPDFSSGDEAAEFLGRLARLFRFIGISDCRIEQGSMRADVNLSVRPKGQKCLGTRTEMKNLSSFKSVKRACNYEAERQIKLISGGGEVRFETRRFDEDSGVTLSMRSKESTADYRYFREPDIPGITLTDDYINSVAKNMPELPEQKFKRFTEDFLLPKNEAEIILSSVELCSIFEESAQISALPCLTSKLLCRDLLGCLNRSGRDISNASVDPIKIAKTAVLLNEGQINSGTAGQVICKIVEDDIEPVAYVTEHDLFMISDETAIKSRISAVLIRCSKAADEYKNGKDKAFGFIVGQVMADLKGKADPLVVNKILREMLN